ncbi:TPA: hypothetical protein ACPJ0S_003651 [Vibrio alginolyticus]
MKSMFSEGSVLARPFVMPQVAEQEQTETAFFESVTEDQLLESINRASTIMARQDAAAACVQWVNGGDSSIDNLDAMLFGMAGGDDDTELTDAQAALYESLQEAASEFIAQVGQPKEGDMQEALEDPEAADRIFESLEHGLGNVDSDEAIAEFAVRESMMLEALKKVIRDGKVTYIKTNRRKRRMSAAQKAALKKARAKAHSSSAKAARKKANRMRDSRGMDK